MLIMMRWWFVLLCPALFAQFDGPYENLKVLPEDISKQEIRAIMRGWSMDLGLRCTDCHYSETGKFEDIDFVSDKLEKKNTAREMYKMMVKLNQDFFKPQDKEISCYTCHHGTDRPQRLSTILLEDYREGGITALEQSYRELREKYYGQGAYNFAAWAALSRVSEQLMAQQSKADIKRIHELNLEFNPEYDYSHLVLASHYVEDEPNDELAKSHFAAAMKGNAFWTPRRVGQMAGMLMQRGKPDAARKALELLVEVVPDNADAHANLGDFFKLQGDIEAAKQAYTTALAKNPEHKRAHKGLASLKKP
jgi:tetratricopeptide (TPR) repeat protein